MTFTDLAGAGRAPAMPVQQPYSALVQNSREQWAGVELVTHGTDHLT